MDTYKLFGCFDEDELHEIADKANRRVIRYYSGLTDQESEEKFIYFMIYEIGLYLKTVDFEPLVLRYTEQYWHDSYSKMAMTLKAEDEAYLSYKDEAHLSHEK